ncbi:MAG: hypothetical protein QNJ48_10115 [Desulfobacterales bacterium]|nr:hypothetical protein [Desulfobacterales bacterium]
MIGKRLRSIPMRAAVIFMLPFLMGGCFFNLSEKKDFKSWYYGDPGLAGALGEDQCDRYADHIEGPRHPYYLHFRTPEILLQPQGGAHYPERQTSGHRGDDREADPVDCERVAKGWETFRFDTVDAGLVDTVIPYRKATAINDRERGAGRESLAYAGGVVYNTGLTAVMKAPIYVVHDILKTIYIPVAGTYYLFKPDEPSEAPSNSIQNRDDPPSEEVFLPAVASVAYLTADARGAAPQATLVPAGPTTHLAGSASVEAVADNEAPDTRENPPSPPAGLLSDEGGTSTTNQGDTSSEALAPEAADPVSADAAPASDENATTVTPAQPEKTADDTSLKRGTVESPATAEGDAATKAPELPAAMGAGEAHPPETAATTEAADEATAGIESVSDEAATAGSDAIASDRHLPVVEGTNDPQPQSAAEEAPAHEVPATAVQAEGTTDEADTASPVVVGPESGPVSTAMPPTDDEDRTIAETPDQTPAETKAAEAQMPPEMPASVVPGEDERDQQHQAVEAQTEAPSMPDPPETQSGAGSEEQDAPMPAADQAPAVSRTGTAAADPDEAPMPDSETSGMSVPEARTTSADLEQASDTVEAVTTDEAVEQLDAEDGTGAALSPPAAAPAGASGADADAAESEGESLEIVEEDLLTPPPSGSESPTAEAEDARDAAGRPGAMPPTDTGEGPDSMASVSPDQDAAPPEAPAVLEARDKVRIAKGKLRKKVAFIGFHSRAANVDAKTRAGLQDLLWPVFEKECRKDLVLMHRGDADYPAALDALMRDQFGHLNSFELTTVARFSGLNAIIAGTIINIGVSKELSGILWYKTPEGRLRITILAEVFDAETGTKLFDHTYIREAEVEELEPGAGEKPRQEDLPILEAALQDVAEEMGDHVCEALADQPWRAFVAGIDGNRITLSSGQNAGLQPGNILGVYNSQIIDGLNNQQFFLTGEKVGRIQVIHVYADRSEALLIEGQGLRDYSVAIPE